MSWLYSLTLIASARLEVSSLLHAHGHSTSNLRRARATASLNAWAQSGGQVSALRTLSTSQLTIGSRISCSVKSGAKSAQPSRIFASRTIMA